MKDLGSWLKDVDPAAGARPAEDVARLRAATLSAAEGEYSSDRSWPGATAVVLTLVLAFALSGWASGRWPAAPVAIVQQAPQIDQPAVGVVPASATDASVRQLQFATPGGTRIIWVFNPDFSL